MISQNQIDVERLRLQKLGYLNSAIPLSQTLNGFEISNTAERYVRRRSDAV